MKNFYRDGGLVISVSALVIALVIIQGYIYTKDINVFWMSAPFVVLIGGDRKTDTGHKKNIPVLCTNRR